jgi:aryl sulfotransferase
MRNFMAETLPEKSAIYLGPITDTSRWDNFKYRPDDFFICTPPKCGTTWTQAISAMLVFGSHDHGQQSSALSPWIDASFAPIDEYLAQIELQSNRRFIKTHTPLDGIPYHPECNYFVVLRDPRDAYFSGLNHRDNMNNQEMANQIFPNGADAFADWLKTERTPPRWDLVSLESITHFFKSYWQYRHLPNIHIFHYSDMQRDLPKVVKQMADALGLPFTDAEIKQFADAASFDVMKKNADQFAPESGTGMWKAESAFFATGKNQQWKNQLSEEELAAFDVRLKALLPAEEAAWLLSGNG